MRRHSHNHRHRIHSLSQITTTPEYDGQSTERESEKLLVQRFGELFNNNRNGISRKAAPNLSIPQIAPPPSPTSKLFFFARHRRRLFQILLSFLALLVLLQLLGSSHRALLARHLCANSGASFDDGKWLFRRLLNCRQFAASPERHLANYHNSLIFEPWDQFVPDDEDGIIVRVPPEGTDSDEMRLWREREALAALHAARRTRGEGNLKRARSIIEHAYSLAPYNADILTEYGIYVEMARSDVVEAEGFYLKALVRDPKHEEALIRRQKALPLVEEIDNRMMREIHRKRDRFMHIPRNDSGLRRSMRESYFAHVYHTVAMEGNTINLAQTRVILETRMAVAGKSIAEHNEILGLDSALRYLNQSLTAVDQITLEHILALHKRVLGFADPLAAGVIRTVQVFVGSFRPPEPEFVQAEMEELVAWLNDEDTQRLDAVEVAALTHYKLVFIHPFMDGNGRTARLLMNWILLRAGFPPVIIPVEQRHRYYHVLREANEGDLRPFIRFIAELTDRTLESLIASSNSSLCEIGSGAGCSVEQHQQRVVGGGNPELAQPFCTMEEPMIGSGH